MKFLKIYHNRLHKRSYKEVEKKYIEFVHTCTLFISHLINNWNIFCIVIYIKIEIYTCDLNVHERKEKNALYTKISKAITSIEIEIINNAQLLLSKYEQH